MSVIVKGMEMPTSCEWCEVENFEQNSDGYIINSWCPAISNVPSTLKIRRESRLPLCPLRPLPKRHGRLIEAERLRAEFPYPSEGMGGWRNPTEAMVHKTGIWAAIDCAETIVEAEE